MQILQGQTNPETVVNENFAALAWAAVYARRPLESGGPLDWGYYGGRWSGLAVAQGVLTLTNAATNYIVVNRSTGAISVSTSTTNWNAASTHLRVYLVTASGGAITGVEDHRAGAGGVHGWPAA